MKLQTSRRGKQVIINKTKELPYLLIEMLKFYSLVALLSALVQCVLQVLASKSSIFLIMIIEGYVFLKIALQLISSEE